MQRSDVNREFASFSLGKFIFLVHFVVRFYRLEKSSRNKNFFSLTRFGFLVKKKFFSCLKILIFAHARVHNIRNNGVECGALVWVSQVSRYHGIIGIMASNFS